jgi:hypothetical protein
MNELLPGYAPPESFKPIIRSHFDGHIHHLTDFSLHVFDNTKQ